MTEPSDNTQELPTAELQDDEVTTPPEELAMTEPSDNTQELPTAELPGDEVTTPHVEDDDPESYAGDEVDVKLPEIE